MATRWCLGFRVCLIDLRVNPDQDLLADVDVDLESGGFLKHSVDSQAEFEEFSGSRYPESVRVFTDGPLDSA